MYLSAAEFIDRYTEREAVMLSADVGSNVVNTARLERGLIDASAQVDGYLGRRFALPLLSAVTMQPVVPDVVKRLTGDIARYLMTGTHVRETEAIRNRYKDAMAELKRIAEGEATVGVELALASSVSAPAGGASSVRSGGADFGSDRWAGY